MTILDSDGNLIPSQILANGNGTIAEQAALTKGGGNYLIMVAANTTPGTPATGNYALVMQFGANAAALSTLAAGAVPVATGQQAFNLYVGESQLMDLLLSAATASGTAAPGAAVQMIIRDQTGKIVYSLTAGPGDTTSGAALFLTPGAYSIHIIAVGPTGAQLTFSLTGEGISDPIGPVIQDPTLAPVYSPPPGTPPGWFQYPGGVLTKSPFLLAPVGK